MTVNKIAEHFYNNLGWRFSDRDRMIVSAVLTDQPELYGHFDLNEREVALINFTEAHKK